MKLVDHLPLRKFLNVGNELKKHLQPYSLANDFGHAKRKEISLQGKLLFPTQRIKLFSSSNHR